jgi:UDP-glucose 4-epimerase
MAVPLDYYSVNFSGTLSLLEAMRDHGVRNLVFSSSATVYGTPESVPVLESSAIHPVNPYGQTKAMVEQVLSDLCASDSSWRIACLRYFNPAGAHPSGLLGEDPADQPNNLMPYLVEVAEGRRPHLNIFGNDYPTIDGTGMRDYIHVTDLVAGHVAALDYLLQHPGLLQVNLGTGTGVSVLQMLHYFEQACGRKIPYQFAPRRPGDIAAYWADPSRAERILDWRAKLDVAAMCRDTWRWRTSQVKQSPPNNAARKLEVAS